jgi:hypothetical protein
MTAIAISGKDYLQMDGWKCSDCGMRWYDRPVARHTHRNCKVLKLYAHAELDGIMVWPQYVLQHTRRRKSVGPDAYRRVFVGLNHHQKGELTAKLASLNDIQIRALIELAYRVPKLDEGARRAVFYDSHRWASSFRTNRAPIVYRVDL